MSTVHIDSDPDEIPFIRPTTIRRRGRRRVGETPSSTATHLTMRSMPSSVSPAPPTDPSDSSEYIRNLMSTPKSRSQDELARQRANNAERMRRAREAETVNQTRRRRTRNAEGTRTARAGENVDQTAERRRLDTVRTRAARAVEAEDAATERRRIDADRTRAARAVETEDAAIERRRIDADRTRAARAVEAEDAAIERRRIDADRTRAARAVEAEDAAIERRRIDADRTRAARAVETEDAAIERRRIDADRTRAARAVEAEDAATERRRIDADRTRAARAVETEETIAERRRLDLERRRAARAIETAEMAIARRQADQTGHRQQRESQTAQERADLNANRRQQRRSNPTFAGLSGQPPPESHYLGQMNHNCSHCGAKFYPGEFPRDSNGTYNTCCRNGSVTLDLFPNYPPLLYDLFVGNHPRSRNFLENSRQFNTALAVASMNVKLAAPPGRGPFVFKAHGAICYETGQAMPTGTPSYGQLFFIDETAATDARMSHSANRNCDQQLMQDLGALIRSQHEYAREFKTLQEVYEEEEEKARRLNTPMNQVRLIFKSDTPDPRRYNRPRVAEVAIVYVGPDGEVPSPRDYTVQVRSGGLRRMPLINKALDPCTYPLFFINGDFGWHIERKRTITNAQGGITEKKLTQKDYYCYYLCVRDDFNPIHWSRRLFQQFTVGSWANVEQCRLDYIRHHQTDLRSEYYSDLRDFIADGADGLAGNRVLLPATFTSSPRYMIASYQDAMAITSKYGKPDLFLTFTCNPKWKEIQENLFPGQTAADRPDLVSRVFRMKVTELKKDLLERNIFGRVTAYIFTVEWQKRGLPHVHWLITLAAEDKPRTPDDVDRLISAEIPDGGVVLEKVSTHMIHRDCGPGSPCWRDDACSKKFPKPFRNDTDMDIDGFPAYRRRDDGKKIQIGQTGTDNVRYYDNTWIVPFNGYLLQKFDAHINVEICTLLHAVKYLFKYVYKGSDRAALKLKLERREANGGVIDEVEEHLDARYVCSPEGFHRLFAFFTHEKSNAVIALAVHEENKQRITFQPGAEQQAIDRNRKTTLLAYFDLNLEARNLEAAGRLDQLGPVDPRTIYYHQFPEHFTFNRSDGKWKRKQRHNNNIGRVHAATPNQRERYCIRLLLHHTKGATSFEELFHVEGQQFTTAFDAAKELGLIQSDDHFDQAMREAAFFRMPHALRDTFATLLAFDEPTNVDELWDKWKRDMSEDFVHRGRSAQDAEALAYFDILEMFPRFGTLLSVQYTRPAPMGDDDVDHAAAADERYNKLTQAQKTAVDAVIAGNQKLIFIDGPGGTGKTFCYETIYHMMKRNNKNVVCCAWSGIAANLLPEGRTVASLFKLNIAQNCESSSISTTSADGRFLKETDVFIIDECSMISVKVLDTIDRLLKDIMNSNVPFGGKTILLGGDFRQVLPIPNKLAFQDPYSCCLKSSPYFQQGNPVAFHRYQLTENMRAEGASEDFKNFLLAVGEGRVPTDEAGTIEIPAELRSSGDLIGEIFEDCYDDADHINARAILCPKNVDVDSINQQILDRMPGESRVFLSADSVVQENPDDGLQLSSEFLNSLTPSGLSHHRLELKIGAIVMLNRNLNVKKGLCNGTRLQVERFNRRNAIQCKFINGTRKGKSVIIPRIDLQSTKGKGMSFVMKRRQFPLKLAFAMTINKAQGQSLEKVGVHLATECFSHGQLYVAFSRAKTANGLKVWVEGGKTRTANVVDQRVL